MPAAAATHCAADLARALKPCPEGMEIEFVQASSYGNKTETTGKVTVSFNEDAIKGRHVLMVGGSVGRWVLPVFDFLPGVVFDILPGVGGWVGGWVALVFDFVPGVGG